MTACLHCTAPLTPAAAHGNGRPRTFCSAACNRRWRRLHPSTPLPQPLRGSRWDALRDWPARRTELGPALPPLGPDEAEARRLRNVRILAAMRDGLDVHALSERFGLSTDALYQVASRAGVRLASGTIPFGVPAP